MVEVNFECFQRSLAYAYAAVLDLRYHCARIYQNINDLQVCLQGFGVQSKNLGAAKYASRHEEVCRGAPVSFDVERCRLVALPALDFEGDSGASGPVLSFYQTFISFHFAARADAEMPEHVKRDVHIWNAFRLAYKHIRVLVAERESHHQAADKLRAVLSVDVGVARDQSAVDSQRYEQFLAVVPAVLVSAAQQHSVRCHNGSRALERSVEQGAASFDENGTFAYCCGDRYGKPCEKPRLAGV